MIRRGGQANFFFKVSKSQIRKSLGFRRSFRYRLSAYFLGVLVRKSQNHKFLLLIGKSQIRKFLQNTALLCFKLVLKVAFLTIFYYVKFE